MESLLSGLTLRRVTQAGWLLLIAWVLIGPRPRRRWHRLVRTARTLLAHPGAFPVIAAVSLGAFLLAVAAQHLS